MISSYISNTNDHANNLEIRKRMPTVSARLQRRSPHKINQPKLNEMKVRKGMDAGFESALGEHYIAPAQNTCKCEWGIDGS